MSCCAFFYLVYVVNFDQQKPVADRVCFARLTALVAVRSACRDIFLRLSYLLWHHASCSKFFGGVDQAMKTETKNLLAVPVISQSTGVNKGKVIAVSLRFLRLDLHESRGQNKSSLIGVLFPVVNKEIFS